MSSWVFRSLWNTVALNSEGEETCQTVANSVTPGQDCPEEVGVGRELKNFAFYLLMVIKSVIFFFKMVWLASRYFRTVGKCNTFEIWFCCITIVKVGIILPLYFIRDINLLYLVFVINSFTTIWLSHVLSIRSLVALNQPLHKIQWSQWMFFLQNGHFVVWLIVAPLFDQTQSYELKLCCDINHIYPFRFVVVFGLDLLHALIELLRTIRSPRFLREKERMKEASFAQLFAEKPTKNRGNSIVRFRTKSTSIDLANYSSNKSDYASNNKSLDAGGKSSSGRKGYAINDEDDSDRNYEERDNGQKLAAAAAAVAPYEEDPEERRTTLQRLEFTKIRAKKKGEYYKGMSLFDLAPKAPLKPQKHMQSRYDLTPDQLVDLNEMEHWHFISVQLWVLTVGNLIMALFQAAVFGLAVWANDYDQPSITPVFITNFGFECEIGFPARWWIAKTSQSEMMYELHPIILHMYVTLAMLVLATVPFKYNRLFKTAEEKELERKNKKRKKEKKARRKLEKQYHSL